MPPISKIFKEIAEAIKTPGVAEKAARGTAAAPKILESAEIRPMVKERAPEVPFSGQPELQSVTRETEDRAATTSERVQALKTQIGGFIRPFPNIAKDLQETLYRGRWRSRAAEEVADRDIADWFSPLQRDPAAQATLLHDYMTTADEVAQAKRYGKSSIRDIDLGVWDQSLERLQQAVDSDPEVVAALAKVRQGLDEQFEDMASRNWIDKTRYLEDYTPIRRINAVIDGLATFYGEDPGALKSRLLSQQQKRTGKQAPRETDMLQVLRATRKEYLRKVAEHEAFLDIIADPTINFTEKFANGEPLPKGLAVFRPGAGGFGSTVKAKEGYFLDGALKAMDPKGYINVGGWVMPSRVVESLEHFNTPIHTGAEHAWYRMGNSVTKMLTVYNPANTNVNRASDLMVAMFLPGEGPAHPLGVLRWYGKANKAAYKGAFQGKGSMVNLHGRDVDVWDLAIREGLTTGTIAHEVSGGIQLPPELLRLHPEAEGHYASWLEETKRVLESDRMATEVAPRIAAGLEAVERTGDWSQFGKTGRDITFRYGAGAPRLSQFPAIRMISPFIQFQGLATARVLEMMNAKSLAPKARIALGLAAVPMSFFMWNEQNDAYKQVELALPEYERNQLHIIVPDPVNPAKPKLDVEGQPVVLRFRYWVPEQVASMVGLGNLAERATRVVQGRDTPIQFAKSIPEQGVKSVSDMLVLPRVLEELMTGKSSSGQKMTGAEWLGRAAPITRIGVKGLERGSQYGAAEGAKTAAGEVLGLRFARARHVDVKLLDAQMQDAVREMNSAKAKFTSAVRGKSGADVTRARKDFLDKVAEVKRIKAQIKAEKEGGYAPPRAEKAAGAARREGVKRALEEGK